MFTDNRRVNHVHIRKKEKTRGRAFHGNRYPKAIVQSAQKQKLKAWYTTRNQVQGKGNSRLQFTRFIEQTQACTQNFSLEDCCLREDPGSLILSCTGINWVSCEVAAFFDDMRIWSTCCVPQNFTAVKNAILVITLWPLYRVIVLTGNRTVHKQSKSDDIFIVFVLQTGNTFDAGPIHNTNATKLESPYLLQVFLLNVLFPVKTGMSYVIIRQHKQSSAMKTKFSVSLQTSKALL